MSTTTQPAPAQSGHRKGLPRWAWALIAVLTVLVLVALAVIVFAPRGRDGATAPASTPAPVATASLADGCLGGVADLDRAVLTAQDEAPLTKAGAASFTATLVRWAATTPPPVGQEVTGQQLLSQDATATAKDFPSGAQELKPGVIAAVDFTDGRYYIESADKTSAIVSYLGTVSGSLNGVSQGSAWVSGAAHLVVSNGTWHLRDMTLERPIADLQQVGVPFSGGC